MQELFNFLHLGVLVPTEDFENTSQVRCVRQILSQKKKYATEESL